MRGYPKFLNSKTDYDYVRENFPREQWLPDFQALLTSAYDWFFEKMLDSEADGVTDDTHKVVVDEEQKTYAQYVFQLNPMCKMLRLGFTEDEVRAIVEG